MPRINPVELLTCLAVLLNSKGGIKSTLEVERIARLMARYSKKLVSKCIYVQVLKATDAELQDLFLSAGGWSLITDWLKEGTSNSNAPLCIEVLDMLLHVPLSAQKLINEGGEVAKKAAKCMTLESKECQKLCCELMKKWGQDLTDYLNGDVESAARFLDYPLSTLLGPESQPEPEPVPTEVEVQPKDSVVEQDTKSDSEDETMPLLDFYPKQGNKKAKRKRRRISDSEEVVKSEEAEEFKGTVPILKFVRKSGKLATTLTNRKLQSSAQEESKLQEGIVEVVAVQELPVVQVEPEHVPEKPVTDESSNDKTETKPPKEKVVKEIKKKSRLRITDDDSDDEPVKPKSNLKEKAVEKIVEKSVEKIVEKSVEKSQIPDKKNERKEKSEKPKTDVAKSEKRNDKDRSGKETKDSREKDKYNGDKRKDSSYKRSESFKKEDREESSSNRSESKRDDKDSKRDDKYRRKDESSKSSSSSSSREEKSRSSSSLKDKTKISAADKSRNDEKNRVDLKKQSEIDQKTLESLSMLARTGISMMKIPKKVKTEEEKKEEEKKAEEKRAADRQKDNFSILDRKPTSTVKVFSSKFRSHGCEEAPSKPPLKKIVKKELPILPLLKRPIAPIMDITPPEKKMKSPLALLEVEEGKALRPGGIKLISPRPLLQDSSLFMDALAAGTKSDKKRKRKISESEGRKEDEPKNEEAEVVTSPKPDEKPEAVLSPVAVKPQFKFYKDILDEEEEDSDDKPLAQLKREKEEREERERKMAKIEEEKPEVKEEVKDEVKMEDDTEIKAEVPAAQEESNTSSEESPSLELGDLPPAPPIVLSNTIEDDMDDIFDEPKRLVNGNKGVLVYHRAANRVKKSLKWRAEEELHEYFYFELDETERVNVNRMKCQDIKQADKLMEKDAFVKSRKLNSDDIMEEKVSWRLPTVYDLPEQQVQFIRGVNSLDKEVQLARQSVTLETIFLSKNMIPSTPTEPDPEVPLERIETLEIPLEEVEPTPDSLYDHTLEPWPEARLELTDVPVHPFTILPGPPIMEPTPPFFPIADPLQYPPGMPLPPAIMAGLVGPRPPMAPPGGAGGTWMTGDGSMFQEAPAFGFQPNPMMPFGPGMFPQFEMPMGPMPGMPRHPNEMEFGGGPSRGNHQPRPPYRPDRRERDRGDRGREPDHYRRERPRDDRGREDRGREDRYRREPAGRSSRPCVHFLRGACKFEHNCAFFHPR